MALKAVPITPVEAHRLDDPRRPSTHMPAPALPHPVDEPQPSAAQPTLPARSPRTARLPRSAAHTTTPAPPAETTTPADQPIPPVNPYARAGRPHQVAVSLYAPQWEQVERQCAELRAGGVPDATVTRWLFALLHFRAPRDTDAATDLIRRWARLEADEDGPYFALRKEARGIRFFDTLWERQRAIVNNLRHDSAHQRPTLAAWTAAVLELEGPNTVAEARELLRDLRILLAGDPPDHEQSVRPAG